MPDYFLFLCSASETRTNCEIDEEGDPTQYNKHLYSLEWSRFGNVVLERWDNNAGWVNQ